MKINEYEFLWEFVNIYELCFCNLYNCWKYLYCLKILKDCVEKKIFFLKILKCYVFIKLIVVGFLIERYICIFCNIKFFGLIDFFMSYEWFILVICCVWYIKYEIIYMYFIENSL